MLGIRKLRVQLQSGHFVIVLLCAGKQWTKPAQEVLHLGMFKLQKWGKLGERNAVNTHIQVMQVLHFKYIEYKF